MIKLILLFVIALSLQAFSEDNQYPFGVTPTNVNPAIVTVLKQEKWDIALSMWFGKVYVSSIPNLICFIDKSTDSVKIALVQNHKKIYPPELFNQKHLWVVIFSEKNFNVSEAKDSGLSISNSILAYQAQSSQVSIGAVAKLLLMITAGQSFATADKSSSNDTTIVHNYPMKHWVYDTLNHDTLYSEMSEFKLTYNSKNRIVISPLSKCEVKTNFRSVDFNFGNFERMSLGISFGGGYSYCKNTPSYPLMIFGQIYLIQPTQPIPRISLAITGGTNLSNKVTFTNIIGGLRIGDLYYKNIDLYNLGFIIAPEWVLDQNNARRIGLFLGLDYRL